MANTTLRPRRTQPELAFAAADAGSLEGGIKKRGGTLREEGPGVQWSMMTYSRYGASRAGLCSRVWLMYWSLLSSLRLSVSDSLNSASCQGR